MHRLQNRLAAPGPAVIAWCGITDARYLEAVSTYDFDGVLLDMQHGFFDETSALNGIATVAARGKAPMVRIPLGRWDMASRAMDFGALGVVAPMVNTAADAQAFAKAMKYIPIGERSFGPAHAAGIYRADLQSYLSEIDGASLALAMIETREAVAALDDILAVEGIDGILIGPGDLSISVRQNRIPDAYGPDTKDIAQHIINTAKAAGKCAATFALTTDHANMLNGMGADLISVGVDETYLDKGLASHIEGLDFRS